MWRAVVLPTRRFQHAGAPAALEAALRLPHGSVAAERARQVTGAGKAAIGLGLLEQQMQPFVLPPTELLVLQRCRLVAVASS